MESLLKRLSDEIASVVASISPSIVEIQTLQVKKGWFGRDDSAFSPAGAGVILKPDGLIVTNHHVVDGASRVRVSLSDSRSFEADLIGLDAVADIAALTIPASDLPAARVRTDGPARPGEIVFAVGHPLGLTGSVSTGIVSAPARFEYGPGTPRPRVYIQTDAAINPGNSGGALVGCDGGVVGITTWGVTATGIHGLAFAIPIGAATRIVAKLQKDRRVQYGTVGASGSEIFLPSNAVKAHGLEQHVALQIEHIEPNSPAASAGLEPLDWIVSIGGRRIDSLESFLDALDDFINENVEVTIVRLTGEIATKRLKVAPA